jgi:predicted amidohydrolase
MKSFVAAAVQMTSVADRGRNLETALRLVDEAADRGATFVALPENVDFIGPEREKLAGAEEIDGPTFAAFSKKAAEREIHLLAGTIAETSREKGKGRNTSALFGPDGKRLAAYRKIHLFDVSIPDGPSFKESDLVTPGTEVVDAKTPLAHFGLSICYDLRFPELYRELSARGCEVLLVPSAFTYYTGRVHWEMLLRARAVENTSWVIAPAQTGRHSQKRQSWGHTMIIDPWGTVVGQVAEGTGFCLAEISAETLERVRRELPSLRHRKLPFSAGAPKRK